MSSPRPAVAGASLVLLGHGRWGRVYAHTLRARGLLGGIAVASETSAAEAAHEYAVPVDTSAERLLQRVSPSALVVMTPTHRHVEDVSLALAHGLPCLVAKPVALTAVLADALHEAALVAQVPLLVAHELAWSPGLRALLQAAEAGRIGAVAQASLVRVGDADATGPAMRRPMPEEPGRNLAWLYETVMHDFTVLNRLAGGGAPSHIEVDHVFASAAAPELEARAAWPGGFRASLRWNGDPALAFGFTLDVVGAAGAAAVSSKSGASRAELRRHGAPVESLPRGLGAQAALVDELLRLCAEGGPVRADSASAGAAAITAATMLVHVVAARTGQTFDPAAVSVAACAANGGVAR